MTWWAWLLYLWVVGISFLAGLWTAICYHRPRDEWERMIRGRR